MISNVTSCANDGEECRDVPAEFGKSVPKLGADFFSPPNDPICDEEMKRQSFKLEDVLHRFFIRRLTLLLAMTIGQKDRMNIDRYNVFYRMLETAQKHVV